MSVVCILDNLNGVNLPTAPPTLPATSCNLTCTTSPLELCGGVNAVQLYHFENLTPVLRALALPLPTGNAVLSLIQSVTATNVATVAPVSFLFTEVFEKLTHAPANRSGYLCFLRSSPDGS